MVLEHEERNSEPGHYPSTPNQDVDVLTAHLSGYHLYGLFDYHNWGLMPSHDIVRQYLDALIMKNGNKYLKVAHRESFPNIPVGHSFSLNVCYISLNIS